MIEIVNATMSNNQWCAMVATSIILICIGLLIIRQGEKKYGNLIAMPNISFNIGALFAIFGATILLFAILLII